MLRNWDPSKMPLPTYIRDQLDKVLTKERISRRDAVRLSPVMGHIIEICRNNLSDTYYWILIKCLVLGIKPKHLTRFFEECPEVRLRSVNSIGTTLSRALAQLEKVCPAEFQHVVIEYRRTRKRAGRRARRRSASLRNSVNIQS